MAIVSKEITENIIALSELPIIGSMAAQLAADKNIPDDFSFGDWDFIQKANYTYHAQNPEHKTVQPLTIGAVAAALAIRFPALREAAK